VGSRGQAERIDPEALADPALLTAWRELAELRENPFLTPEWYRTSLEARDEEPFAIAWRVADELRGVLPLVRVSRRPVKLLRFAGARRGDWFSPACRPRDEATMAAACAELLLRERRSWQVIRLDRVDTGCAWPAALARDGGIAVAPARRLAALPYVELGEGGFEAYLASRSRNFRSQLHRRRARLEREHGLRFRMTSMVEELDNDLDAFWRLHDERWRERGGSSSAEQAARRHLRLFAAAALRRGWLRLWTALADGKPAASWYGWRIGGRYCYSLSGMSRRFERLSLGNVLLAHTIEQAAAEGATVYDLMWGDEAYKRRFETGRRYADTWLLARRGHPARPAIELGMRVVGGAEQLPPSLRRPLKRLAGAVSRS
jgi:CelD/BcsL family acetyltransferase involved in cellulose biosynthesis